MPPQGGTTAKRDKPGFYPPINPGATQHPEVRSKEMQMEALIFFVVWLGGAALHTLFDLRIKPVLQSVREESDLP